MRSLSSWKLRECISPVLLLIAPGSDKCLPMIPMGIVWKSLRDGEYSQRHLAHSALDLRLLIRVRIAGVVSCERLVRPATESAPSSLLHGHRLRVRGGKQPSPSFHT